MKKTCPTCGGTGQVGFFQGVSRFLLTWEECPECSGTGMITGRKTEEKKERTAAKPPKNNPGNNDS